jgi:hypothetical protein
MKDETKQTAVDWVFNEIILAYVAKGNLSFIDVGNIKEQAKEMQQEQAQLYATFVLMCVNNNLPPITFNDWVTNIRR